MPGIFINYRRDDAPGVAGRLYDHLAGSFSHRDLFIDVDAMKPGLDFVDQLDTQVSQCDVMLALIGPHWLDAEDERGRKRLQDEHDYVRIEIASALKRGIPVIPVLVHGAEMPDEGVLPDDLKTLTRRQALELRHTRFAADADAIETALKALLPGRKRWWIGLLAGACVLVAGLAAWWALAPVEVPPAPQSAPAAAPPVPVQPQPSPTEAFTVEPDTDRPGSDFHSIELPLPRYELCRDACADLADCVAYTYVRPGVQGEKSRCWLKSSVPRAVPSQCCVSGVRR